MSRHTVLGIGLSSGATAAEVAALVAATLAEHGLALDEVATIATRACLAGDPRLRLGPPVRGFADGLLEAASAPCTRSFGIRARVAETATVLAGAVLVGGVRRSAHVTLAVGRRAGTPGGQGSPPFDARPARP